MLKDPAVKLISGWSLPEWSPTKGRLKYWTRVEVTNNLAHLSTEIITAAKK